MVNWLGKATICAGTTHHSSITTLHKAPFLGHLAGNAWKPSVVNLERQSKCPTKLATHKLTIPGMGAHPLAGIVLIPTRTNALKGGKHLDNWLRHSHTNCLALQLDIPVQSKCLSCMDITLHTELRLFRYKLLVSPITMQLGVFRTDSDKCYTLHQEIVCSQCTYNNSFQCKQALRATCRAHGKPSVHKHHLYSQRGGHASVNHRHPNELCKRIIQFRILNKERARPLSKIKAVVKDTHHRHYVTGCLSVSQETQRNVSNNHWMPRPDKNDICSSKGRTTDIINSQLYRAPGENFSTILQLMYSPEHNCIFCSSEPARIKLAILFTTHTEDLE